MSVDPVLLQGALAIPISTGLVVYTLVRWDRRILHGLLTALLTALTLWLAGTVLKLSAGPEWLRLAGLDVELVAVIFMPCLFMITMAHFARSPAFENSAAPSLALLTVSGMFLLAYLTDDLHRLMITDRSAALAGAHLTEWAGPFYWALQLWIGLCDLGGIAYCLSVLLAGRTRAERGRAAMILAAVALPIAAHVVHVMRWLPIDFTLAPSTIALTGVFFVHGVHRYGLLGGQSIVRHDLIEHLDAGLLLADEHGTVLDANRSAERLIGASREHMRGVALPEVLALLEPDDASRDVGERIVGLPLDGSRVEAEIHTGDDRVIELVAGAVPSFGSQPAGRFVSLEDRTAQRRTERLLRERQKLESVGILAAGVAHEVNNPLAYVRANLLHVRALAEALQKPEAEEAQEACAELPAVVDESVEGIDRIARIVESMLRFARTSDESFRRIDLGRVVDEALRLAALQRDTTVRVERRGGPVPAVLGSAERLVQVLLNLFLNARQALGGRDDGVIAAETTTEGDHVLVHVRDNGPGIPAELQQRIFDPFFTTRGPDSGTGLGLSIAFDIAREHGGTLEVSSRVGAGSCFTLRLAAAPDEDAPPDGAPA